jgi:hypothetical protein
MLYAAQAPVPGLRRRIIRAKVDAAVFLAVVRRRESSMPSGARL